MGRAVFTSLDYADNEAMASVDGFVPASSPVYERRWDDLKGCKGFCWKAKALTVSCVPYSPDSGFGRCFILVMWPADQRAVPLVNRLFIFIVAQVVVQGSDLSVELAKKPSGQKRRYRYRSNAEV